MAKEVIPFNRDYLDRVISYMQGTHEKVVAERISKTKSISALPSSSSPWTEKQQKIIDGFKGWDYGCQHKAVVELVSLLVDVPVEVLDSTRKSFRQSMGGSKYRFGEAYRGMFVRLISKKDLYIKAPLGSIFYIGMNTQFTLYPLITSDVHTVNSIDSYGLRTLDDMTWQKDFAVATEEEIKSFLTIFDISSEKLGRWNYLVTLFADAVPLVVEE